MFRLQKALLEVFLDLKPIDVDMFHSVVVHRIMSNADHRLVVAAENDGFVIGYLEIIKHMLDPHDLVNTFRHSAKLSFGASLGDNILFLASPSYKVTT